MSRSLTEIIPESTHLKTTLVGAVTFIGFVIAVVWKGAVWAEDVRAAQDNVNTLTTTVSTLSTAVAQQSMVVSQQSKDTDKLLQALKESADRQQDDHDRLVRIEAQTVRK